MGLSSSISVALGWQKGRVGCFTSMPRVEDMVEFSNFHTLGRGEGGMRVLLAVVYHQPAPPIIEEPTSSEGGLFLLDLVGFPDRHALARPP